MQNLLTENITYMGRLGDGNPSLYLGQGPSIQRWEANPEVIISMSTSFPVVNHPIMPMPSPPQKKKEREKKRAGGRPSAAPPRAPPRRRQARGEKYISKTGVSACWRGPKSFRSGFITGNQKEDRSRFPHLSFGGISFSFFWGGLSFSFLVGDFLSLSFGGIVFVFLLGGIFFLFLLGGDCLSLSFGGDCLSLSFGGGLSFSFFWGGFYFSFFWGGFYFSFWGDVLSLSFGEDCLSLSFGGDCRSILFFFWGGGRRILEKRHTQIAQVISSPRTHLSKDA